MHSSAGSMLIALLLVTTPLAADDADECMRGFLATGADDLTLGEMRLRCRTTPDSTGRDAQAEQLVERRLAADRGAAANPYSIQAHKPNYVLAGAYNHEGWDALPYQDSGDPSYRNDDVEMQFQMSLKVPLALDLFNDRMDVYFAYTNRSFWQIYNRENSEPFRETNHEPEIWGQFYNDWQIAGFTNAVNAIGFVHQSNGATEPRSRSWNRLFANFIFENNHWVLSFKPWVWVAKDKSRSDNPDIDDYLGHGEIRAAWARNRHVVSAMVRNQIESGFDRGATEVSWSFPVLDYPYLKGYLQYFYGYGESLIDYNRKVNRIGLGLSFTDWVD